jgi:serine/threonine protein kinase
MLRFGRYQVVRKLNEGGMGQVYLGLAHGADGFQKPVVIKRIHTNLTGDRDALRRFVSEAKLTMSMSHGNLVQVLDLGKLEEEYFIVLEQVDGRDLREVLRRCQGAESWPSIEVSLHLVCQVLRGLDYAHRRTDERGRPLGIVHRDVKPGNILCSFEGEVKLTDFGAAFSGARDRLTAHGMVIGSVAYMSPEQVRGETVDRRSDIFSVGVVLYQLLCRVPPFLGKTFEEIGRAITSGRFLPPAAHGVELGPRLEQVLLRALARDPAKRFVSAEAMLLELEACARDRGQSVTASDLRGLLRWLFAAEQSQGEGEETLSLPAVDRLIGEELAVESQGIGELTTFSLAGARLESRTASTEREPIAARGADAARESRAVESDRSATATAGELRSAPRPRSRKQVAAAGAIALGGAGVLALLGYLLAAGSEPQVAAPPERARDASRALELDRSVATTGSAPTVADRGLEARPSAPDRGAASQRPLANRGFGHLVVSTEPAYAVVYLGARRLDTTPCRIRLPAGRHQLRLVNPELRLELRRVVQVKPGEESKLVLRGFQ